VLAVADDGGDSEHDPGRWGHGAGFLSNQGRGVATRYSHSDQPGVAAYATAPVGNLRAKSVDGERPRPIPWMRTPGWKQTLTSFVTRTRRSIAPPP